MRPKVVFAILLVAAGVVAVAVMLSKISHPQPAAAPATAAAAPSNPVPVAEPAVVIATAPITATNVDTNAIARQQLDHEEFVENRADELMDLARDDSAAAHQKIVDELKNQDKGIRKAALEALEQANDRSVVPQMQQIADQTDDPDYKQAIQDAIDFINLPSLAETLQQRKAQAAAGTIPTPQPRTPHPGKTGPPGPQ